MRTYTLCALFVLVGACQSEGPRFTSEDDGCSFSELSGWTTARRNGSLLLRHETSPATIAIRAVPSVNDWVEERTPALVNPAVARILRALPDVRGVAGPKAVRASLEGAAFEATFVPQGKREQYLRRHVVFYGEETDRVFHVVLTVPADKAESAAKAFEQVIDSFREEV
jgi:hypothetical protein